MTATTGAPWNLVYQELSDAADISGSVQDLADSVDTAVQSLYDAQTIGAAKPSGRMAATANQSIPNNTDTNLSWAAGSEYFDNDTMIDNGAPTDRITLTSTGIYLVILRATFVATASGGGVRQLSITHSTLGVVARNTQLGTVSETAAITIVQVVPCYVAGQFVTFQAFQTSSAAEHVAPRQAQAFRLTPI